MTDDVTWPRKVKSWPQYVYGPLSRQWLGYNGAPIGNGTLGIKCSVVVKTFLKNSRPRPRPSHKTREINESHSLCGSNKLLYKQWALSMGKGKFRPPTAPTFIDRSSWNSNLWNMSGRPPQMPNVVKIRLRGWAGRTPSLPQFWFYPLFFVCPMQCIAWDRI